MVLLHGLAQAATLRDVSDPQEAAFNHEGVFYDTTLICFSDPTNPSCKGSRFSPITYSTVLKKRNIPPLCGGLDCDQELTKAAVRGNESGEMYVIESGFIGFIDL